MSLTIATKEKRKLSLLQTDHSRLELAEYWLIAISGIILFIAGMFELPMSYHYYITSVPGLSLSISLIYRFL